MRVVNCISFVHKGCTELFAWIQSIINVFTISLYCGHSWKFWL